MLANEKDASSRKVRQLLDRIAKLTVVNGIDVGEELDADFMYVHHGYRVREDLRCICRRKPSASVLEAADGGKLINKSTAIEVAPTPYQVVLEFMDDFICSVQQSPYIGYAYFAFRKNPT